MRARGAQALRKWGRAVRVVAVGERGAGTVLIVGVIGVLLAAALGGATALSSVLAPGDPCEVAGRVARANGAEVTACTVAGEDVVVEVSVGIRVLGVARTAASAARAGPVDGFADGLADNPADDP